MHFLSCGQWVHGRWECPSQWGKGYVKGGQANFGAKGKGKGRGAWNNSSSTPVTPTTNAVQPTSGTPTPNPQAIGSQASQ